MLTFEQAQDALTEIADKIPPEIYRGLNGGIILLPEEKLHPKANGKILYIMGEYHYQPLGFGRYITIYYGSFCRIYSGLSDTEFVNRLEKTLNHELIHHLEGLAGDKSLEIKDAIDLEKYKQ